LDVTYAIGNPAIPSAPGSCLRQDFTLTQDLPLDPVLAFTELGRIDLATMDLQDVLSRVSELAKLTIPGADEVSVTLVQDGKATTAAFTGQLAMDLDEKQYETGFGPCLDAAHAGETIVINDMAQEVRWPDFTPRALEQGAHSSMSVGLPIQHAVTGAINMYAHKPSVFDDASAELAQTFASYAAIGLANAHLYQSTATLAAQMEQAMASRAVIEQAKGIVAAQLRCSTEDAFTAISRMSQSSHRKLREVAAEIVGEATGNPSTSEPE
jgi:GAF domain-containing protein